MHVSRNQPKKSKSAPSDQNFNSSAAQKASTGAGKRASFEWKIRRRGARVIASASDCGRASTQLELILYKRGKNRELSIISSRLPLCVCARVIWERYAGTLLQSACNELCRHILIALPHQVSHLSSSRGAAASHHVITSMHNTHSLLIRFTSGCSKLPLSSISRSAQNGGLHPKTNLF
jgi:hypothetical protein